MHCGPLFKHRQLFSSADDRTASLAVQLRQLGCQLRSALLKAVHFIAATASGLLQWQLLWPGSSSTTHCRQEKAGGKEASG